MEQLELPLYAENEKEPITEHPDYSDWKAQDEGKETDLGDCEANNCGDPADGVGPDGNPYCAEHLKNFPDGNDYDEFPDER